MINKKHTAKFKSMVALEAAKETKTLNELASKYEVYPAQISEWKKHLLEGVEEIFSTRQKKDTALQKKIEDLYRTVGEITMERDWLKKKLHLYP